jgi:FAD/FMN-containing dehydrogenase
MKVAEKSASRSVLELVGDELRGAIGADLVKDDELVLVSYASDISPVPPRRPAFVVLPEERDHVAAILKIAGEHQAPVGVMAGGVNATGTAIPPEGGIAIDLKRMDRIVEINTDSGYALVQPGVNQDQLSAALRAKGYRMHISTAPGGAMPLGGSLQRPSGSLSNRHLDHVVDLEVVLADGTVFNTGSSLFPHAGHHLRYGPFPDLAGLFTCSYGTLGIVTQASLRIYPINEANRVHLAAFDSFECAVDYMKDLINNNIPEHCIIWNWQLYKAFELKIAEGEWQVPPEVKLDPRQPPEGTPYNIVTSFLSGYEETVLAHESVCEKVARKYNGRILSEEEAGKIAPGGLAGWTELYKNYHPVPPNFFALGQYLAWITFSEPKDVKKLERFAVETLAELKIPPVCYYAQPFDFGRSIFFRIFCFPDPKASEKVQDVLKTYRSMFDTAMEMYGAVPMRFKFGWPSLDGAGTYGEVLKKIKKTLDPYNILNRGIGLFQEN